MFYIRVDGNCQIGTGHVMRCLSIAKAMQEKETECVFLLADETMKELVQRSGFQTVILHTNYCAMEEELEVLPQKIKGKDNMILVDSYQATPQYIKALRAFGKVAYIDDKNTFACPADYLINYNIYAEEICYPEEVLGVRSKKLLGCAYMPLRKEFQGIEYRIRKEAQNILLTTGGGDLYNLAGQLVRKFLAMEKEKNLQLRYHVVSGQFNQNLPELLQLEKKHENVHIHQRVENMAALMQQCDIAITAGGTTVYELCAVGIPFLCISFVDNQERIAQSFEQQNIACYSGDYLKQGKEIFSEILQEVWALAKDYKRRKTCSEREQSLVDGYGAWRIAAAVLQR